VTKRFRRPGSRLAITIITIFAITGTLSACGRYGSPVRAVPTSEPIDPASDGTDGVVGPTRETEWDGEAMDEPARSDKTEETEETEENTQ
jgi:hypothetical protein